MPDYRRAFVPGGTFFFTLVTDQRRPLFQQESARSLLGQVIRECQQRWPFTINAIVLLPEHLHSIWSLPSGDSDYSKRWGWIKKEFTKRWLDAGATESKISTSRKLERRRGVWQPRFWEHTIEDFERHFDYIHYNPVKHGHVRRPNDWPYSSFHRWVAAGVYVRHWASWSDAERVLSFDDISDSVGE